MLAAIHRTMVAQGMSQNALAGACGISTGHLSDIFHGLKTARFGQVDMLCRVLGLTLSEVVAAVEAEE